MQTIRLVLTGQPDAAQQLLAALEAVDGVTRAEALGPAQPQLDDADSSSAGLVSDGDGSAHLLEVDVADAEVARRVEDVSRAAAMRAGAALEIDSDEMRSEDAD